MKSQEPIINFLLSNVFPNENSLDHVSVFGPDAIPGWSMARDVVSTVTADALSKQVQYSRTQPRNKYNDVDIDEDRVIIRTVRMKYASNSTGTDVMVGMNYTPMQYKDGQKNIDQVVKAVTPSLPMGFAIVESGSSAGTARTEVAVCETPELLTTQKPFIHTMTLINEQNLSNGIVQLPNEVCLAAGLNMRPTVQLADGSKTKLVFNTYFCVPPGHILSWVMQQSTHQTRKRHGIYAEELILDSGRMLYYLVGDECFQNIYSDCVRNWLNKQDLQSLRSFNLVFTPVKADAPPPTPEKNVKVTLDMVFTGFPKNIPPEVMQRIAPVLDPHFPLFAFSLRASQIQNYDAHRRELAELQQKAE